MELTFDGDAPDVGLDDFNVIVSSGTVPIITNVITNDNVVTLAANGVKESFLTPSLTTLFPSVSPSNAQKRSPEPLPSARLHTGVVEASRV